MEDSPYAALKIRDFRLMLAGRLLVTVAVQIQGLATSWQIYALTNDPLLMGFAGLAEVIPSISVALYAGHVADVVDRVKIASLASLGLSISLALLALSSVSMAPNNVLVTVIFSIIALTGLARGFYGPAVFGLVGDIVPPVLFGNATAWSSAVWQGSAVMGPILGGVLYLSLGAPATYLVASLLLLGGFFSLRFITSRREIEPEEDTNVFQKIKEGLDFVFSNEIVLAAMALDLFAVLFGSVVAVLPFFVSNIFHMGPQLLGLLRAAPSVGALLSAGVLTHRPIGRHVGVVFLAAVAGFGLCMIFFGLSTNVYLSLALLTLSGMLDGVSVWVRTTIYQLSTPVNMKGRVAAVNGIFIGSSNEIGQFESGLAAKFLGLIPSVIFGGCMTMVVVATAALKAPRLRKLDMGTLYKNV